MKSTEEILKFFPVCYIFMLLQEALSKNWLDFYLNPSVNVILNICNK